MKIPNSPKSQGAIGLNQTLDNQVKVTTISNKAITSPSKNISQLKSSGENNINSEAVINTPKNGLPFQLKSGIEQLSGISMDDVKVHHNSDKPAQLQAHAYAQGADIHLAKGQEKHLPHEAWHVVQQKQGRVKPTTQFKTGVPINDDKGLEKEADAMGARALQMKTFFLSEYKPGNIIQRKPDFTYPENEKPEKTVPEIIPNFDPTIKQDQEDLEPELNEIFVNDDVIQNDNPMSSQSEKESPTKKIEDITTVIIALSKNIKKFKAKKEEEAKKAEAEEVLNRAEKAATNAEEAVKKLSLLASKSAELKKIQQRLELAASKAKKTVADNSVEAARVAAEAEAVRVAAEAEAARVAAEAAEAARIAAENTTLQAINKAEEEKEKAKIKVDEYLGGDSIFGNVLEIASVPGKTMDTVAKYMEAGSENRKMLEDNVGKGAFIGNLADTCELLSTVGNFYYSEKKPADLALLGLTVGKFVTGAIDGINTAMEGGLIGEGLTNTITMLPGIKAGLGAFKNGVEGYQTTLKHIGINELLEKTTHLTPENIEVIEKYRTAIKWKLGEIGVDFILNAAESIAMIFPPAQVGIAVLHASISLFKFGCKQYMSYKDNQELKRSERIGDADVEKLKADKIEEKSGRFGFIDALKSLSKLENYQTDPVTNKDAIIQERQTLKNAIKIVNDSSLGKEPITEANVATFLTLERLTILSIKKEVTAEKNLARRFLKIFKLPQKETIIAELITKGAINFNNISEADINNLDPAASDYFFDKTKESIKEACNRKHISTNERLDILEKLLLTKHDDAIIKNYMIDKYKDQKVYEAADTDKVKYTKTIKKFKLELKL
ncbi:MAG: DUF4157 domain-containing protein [Saprospiraceae bacterium]|nr:DUF4157 domain-containing protein [Saprospiraceae bacterium]